MIRTAVFGGGCFWCTEAVFEGLRGVQSVESGYSGGHVADPTYEQVSSGTTRHAECIRVTYDTDQISYDDLLTVFFASHDPTELNRQGNDVGDQYRSIIFYGNDDEKQRAAEYIEGIESTLTGEHVQTVLEPMTTFYPAEEYHRTYFRTHANAPYCRIIIEPKVAYIREHFAALMNKQAP